MQYKNFYVQLPVRANNVTMLDGVVQNDTANIVHLQLMDGDEPFDFDGFTDIVLTVLLPTLNAQRKNVKVTARISNLEEYSQDNPYSIHSVDPKNGRIDFALSGALTQEEGQYFAQIEILDAGETITTTKLNYRVKDNIASNTPIANILTSDQFASITDLITQLSALVSSMDNWSIAEDGRENLETIRQENERSRVEQFQELSTELSNMMATIRGDLLRAEEYADLSYQYSQLASGPTQEAIEAAIEEMDIPSITDLTSAIENEHKSDKILGGFDDEAAITLTIRKGLEEDLPLLLPGELGFTTDTKDIYIGTSDGNECLTRLYVASDTAPENTKQLWVDTSSNNVIKFYNGTSWEVTANSVFA